MSILSRLGNKARNIAKNPTARKVALGVAGAGALAVGGYAAYKYFKGKKRRSSTARLTSQVKRKALKLQSIKLDKKIFREQMKGV